MTRRHAATVVAPLPTSRTPEARNALPAVVAPLFIARDNSVAVIGRPWRWCRDAARALGVPVIVHGRTALIDAQALRDALLASGKLEQANAAADEGAFEGDATPLPTTTDDVLAALGKRRRSA